MSVPEFIALHLVDNIFLSVNFMMVLDKVKSSSKSLGFITMRTINVCTQKFLALT